MSAEGVVQPGDLAPSTGAYDDVPVTDAAARPALVEGGMSIGEVTEAVAGIVERRVPAWWWPAFLLSLAVSGVAVLMVVYLVSSGVGVWNLNQPVGWAWDITNFVFWIGIGHAGTLISAILFLLRQKWRTSINRAAEAMTLFAVACAGLFPLIHVGRIWRIYFVAPVPNHLGIWPNFRSPLLWDVFAVSTYATVSLLFFYVGLIPDLATLRDRSRSKTGQWLYGFFAMGWRGGNRQWRNYELCYLLLAGLSTPLVLSVHSIVSFDFAVSQVAGWHTTIFPPYFVAGAILSGFAMVLILLVPARTLFGLKNLITKNHLDNMAKILLATSLIVGFAYATEFWTAWYSGNPLESFVFMNTRATGPYAWAFWTMVTCNVLVPQTLWIRAVRRSSIALFVIGILVSIGMWFERFVIIASSLARDALPSSWGEYQPSWVEVLTFFGTFGIFLMLYLLFLRFLPIIAISEVKGVMDVPEGNPADAPSRKGGADASGGLVAEFAGPRALLAGAARLRDAGYTRFDAYSPYPVHGMDRAMGFSRSKLGWWCAGGALAGVVIAAVLQWAPSAVIYPLIVGGKPYASWPAFVPIMFELAVLLAAFATIIGMFKLNGMPDWYHPALKDASFLRASDDRFFLVVDPRDPTFDPDRTATALADAGGRSVTALER